MSYGSISNPSSTQWLYVDLPAIHDSIDHSIANAWVDVIDQHPTSNIRLRMQSVYRSGSYIYGWFGPYRYSFSYGSFKQNMSLPGVGANENAHYIIGAAIPPSYNGRRSFIVSYKISEGECHKLDIYC